MVFLFIHFLFKKKYSPQGQTPPMEPSHLAMGQFANFCWDRKFTHKHLKEEPRVCNNPRQRCHFFQSRCFPSPMTSSFYSTSAVCRRCQFNRKSRTTTTDKRELPAPLYVLVGLRACTSRWEFAFLTQRCNLCSDQSTQRFPPACSRGLIGSAHQTLRFFELRHTPDIRQMKLGAHLLRPLRTPSPKDPYAK